MTALERFEARVVRTDDCWLWTGALAANGYGNFYFDGTVNAHRAAYLLLVGEIPAGLHVLHTCDNRRCVNPDHLFVGTHEDNMADMMRKGRQGGQLRSEEVRGENAPRGKLSAAQARQVRDLCDQGWGPADIGRAYGIARQSVVAIGDRRSWAHLDEAVAP